MEVRYIEVPLYASTTLLQIVSFLRVYNYFEFTFDLQHTYSFYAK